MHVVHAFGIWCIDSNRRVAKYVELAMLTVFLYDYLLTLSREVEVIWPRMCTISTAVYFTTKYLPYANIIYAIVATPLTHCNSLVRFVLALSIISRIGITVTLAARTYALCRQHQIITSVLALLGLATIILDFWLLPPDSCATSLKWILVNAITRLVFEAAVIGLTLFQTLRSSPRLTRLKTFEGNGLTSFILRNGLIYFISVFLMELAGIIITSLALDQFLGAAGSFPQPVAAILIARFILDLRYINSHPNEITTKSLSLTSIHIATQHFRSAIVDEFGDRIIDERDDGDPELGRSASDQTADCELREDSHNTKTRGVDVGFEISEASSVHEVI